MTRKHPQLSRRALAIAVAVSATGLVGTAAIAGPNPCNVPPDPGGVVSLPPVGCAYLSPSDVHEIINGLPPGTTIELGAIHQEFICRTNPPGVHCGQPGGTLGGEREGFSSFLQLDLVGTGVLTGYHRSLSLPVQCETHTGPRPPGPVQSFPTDMFMAQGQLPPGDPDFDLLRITGGSAFGMPSPGHTTLTQLPGGNWAVDSFFDITYRIDFVGRPGGPLSGMSGSTTATIRMSTGSNAVPSLTEWGVLLTVALLLTAGSLLIVRKRLLSARVPF